MMPKLSGLLIFQTFPQFSTKAVDKIVDFFAIDKLFLAENKAYNQIDHFLTTIFNKIKSITYVSQDFYFKKNILIFFAEHSHKMT